MSTSHEDKGGAAPVKWPASRHRQVQRLTSAKPLPRVEKESPMEPPWGVETQGKGTKSRV